MTPKKRKNTGTYDGLEAMCDVIRSHSKSLVEVKGFGCRQKSCDIVFRSVFSSTPVRNFVPPTKQGPTMTNKASCVLVAAFLLFFNYVNVSKQRVEGSKLRLTDRWMDTRTCATNLRRAPNDFKVLVSSRGHRLSFFFSLLLDK